MNIANSDLAGAITAYGRFNLKQTSINTVQRINAMNPKFNIEVVQQDTDAGYFCLDTIVQSFNASGDKTEAEIVEFLDQFCKKVLSPIIQDEASKIATAMNAYKDEILWERECISKTHLGVGKKRYCCLLMDDEGTRLVKPKKKIVGLELKRSDTPSDVKKSLDNVIDLIFSGDNQVLINFIEEYRKKYSSLDIETVAIPSGVSDITKFLDDSSLSLPQHVRASIVHNDLLKKLNLTNFQPIVNGDKIKYVFLKNNPITLADTIAFNDVRFLKETGLIAYIDFNKLYERSFFSPVESLTKAISWNTSSQQVLAGLF